MKRFWHWRQGFTPEDGFQAFTVVSWNLQADMTRSNSDGANRSLLALAKRQLLQGLGMPPHLGSPGICCLQELQVPCKHHFPCLILSDVHCADHGPRQRSGARQ